jgi:formate dehydrogenase beta subunit
VRASGQRVAIVGAGPAGLCAAHILAQLGYAVTMFEALPVLGGMLAVGIPAFRQPAGLLEQMRALVDRPGIEVRLHTSIGRDLPFQQLQEEFDAILLAVGLQRSVPLGIPGETMLDGVIPALQFLRQYHLEQVQVRGDVAVIGGGIATIDVARLAQRAGAHSVRVFVPGDLSDLPARAAEIEAARQEGVVFYPAEIPRSIIGTEDVNVHGMRCQRTLMEEPAGPEKGRVFTSIMGTDRWYTVDVVFVAVGECADLSFLPESNGQILFQSKQDSSREPTCLTNLPTVFVAGDMAGGPRTLLHALTDGNVAAHTIHRQLGKLASASPSISRQDIAPLAVH